MIGVYTVGHSNHPFETFANLLGLHGINAVADVRSQPYSRRNPQYNRERLAESLKARGVAYVFLGKELGARSEDRACYQDGRVQYERLALTRLFRSGVERILQGTKTHRIALMCAEKEPLDCHRTLLVSKALERKGTQVLHILSDGNVEAHGTTMLRLVHLMQLDKTDLFATPELRIEEACRLRESKIAYAK